jgi:hypothetical protein
MMILHAGKGGQKVVSAFAPLDQTYLKYLFEMTQSEVLKEQIASDLGNIVGLQNGYAQTQGDKARKYFEAKKAKGGKNTETISKGGVILPPT